MKTVNLSFLGLTNASASPTLDLVSTGCAFANSWPARTGSGVKDMAIATLPANASMYELLRTGHGSMESLTRLGLSREDLDLRVSDAARRTGLPLATLTQKLES